MAGSFSTDAHNKLVDHILGTTAYTQPSAIYVALYSVAPTAAGGGTELSGGSYARVLHSSWNAASSGQASNNGAITFPTATADWSTAVAFGLFDAATAGNFLGWGDLTTSRTVTTGDDAEFADGALTAQITA